MIQDHWKEVYKESSNQLKSKQGPCVLQELIQLPKKINFAEDSKAFRASDFSILMKAKSPINVTIYLILQLVQIIFSGQKEKQEENTTKKIIK